MKVALVCDWYLPRIGGIELHLQDLARELSNHGHEVVVITSTPGASEFEGVRVRRLEAPRLPRFGLLFTASGFRAVADAIAAERPDVVHAHVSIVSPTAFAAARAAHRQRLAMVVTFHSMIPNTRTLARGVGVLLGAASWKARYTAVSECVANAVRPFAPSQSFVVLPNAIDVSAWRPDSARASSDELRLLSVMRLNGKKRPLALIAMMRRLARMHPNVRIRLRIAGSGPQRAMVTRAIRRAQLGDRVELLGQCSRDRIRELLAESDVFVLPAVRESFGIAALEARAAGLPVIAMSNSGVAEFIENGREGLLARNDRELTAHVASLAMDPERLGAMSNHNRRYPPALDWSMVVDRHVAIYCEAMALRENVRADSNR
ncbi:MAG TPA: glycosyltransferase family 4 protein [Gemmatimonadaceae bacterium]|nr:glycosyltransferase family 4 protein [Gemmatimonadaceae bacterium]